MYVWAVSSPHPSWGKVASGFLWSEAPIMVQIQHCKHQCTPRQHKAGLMCGVLEEAVYKQKNITITLIIIITVVSAVDMIGPWCSSDLLLNYIKEIDRTYGKHRPILR
jgi:hypothetical protein